MERVYNFSAGPATLPLSVLEEIQANLVNYRGTGMSVLEMSHRSQAFKEIYEQAQNSLREILVIPNNYHILFLQGGATLQFSMVPLNLSRGGQIGFVNTGSWASKAYKEAQALGFQILEVASSQDRDFTYIPEISLTDPHSFDYLHITSNNTIFGSQYAEFPQIAGLPLVADMSSDFLSRPFDLNQFGLVYAGAQKNVGPAGVTVVIIREDLIYGEQKHIPVYLKFKTHIEKESMYNTPPTFSIYVMSLVLEWIKEQGGLEALASRNTEQANLLYTYLDQSRLFKNKVEKKARSKMNVVFTSENAEVDQAFASLAKERGMDNLKGHRSAGGLRASIYNAFPDEGIDALINLLTEFEEDNHVSSKNL